MNLRAGTNGHGGADWRPRFFWASGRSASGRLRVAPAAPLALALAFATATGAAANEVNDPAARPSSGRLAPPATLRCDRNQLTSYSGTVTGYQRTTEKTRIEITTDWGSVEAFTLPHPEGHAEQHFLLWGETFKATDWSHIESVPGQVIGNMQAIVWVCEDPAVTPVVDWRPGLPAHDNKHPRQ